MSDYDRDGPRTTTTRTTTTDGAKEVYVDRGTTTRDRDVSRDRDKGGGLGRTLLILLILLALAALVAYTLGLFDIDQTREGALPQVKVEGGQLPSFDADVADVDVGTTNTTIETPKIETEKTTVQTPTISVDKADKE